MSFRDLHRRGYQNYKNNPSHFVLSTDFCIADQHRNSITQPELNLPKSYMFNRVVDPAEFMLGENLNRAARRYDQIPSKQPGRRVSKVLPQMNARRKSRIYSKALDIDSQNAKMKINQEVLPINEVDAEFQESALFDYSKTPSTMYDHAIRPFFDDSGLFPYSINTISNRIVIRTSRISFHSEYMEFPIQTIAKMSVFLALVQGNECVSNIVEVEMKIAKPGVWKPSTFHEFDWVLESDAEISLYVEVVALIRITSDWRPFDEKATLIAANTFKLIDYHKGMFQPIKENKHHIYLNRKGEMTPEGQEAILSFYVSHSQMKYPYLPEYFICPTNAIPIFEKLRTIIFKYLDPFFGNFSLWSPPLLEPVIFSDISSSEKALHMLETAWVLQTDKSLLDNIKKIYPATKALSKTGSFCLLESADSDEKATMRVAAAMINRKAANDEIFKPFHTDEIRGRLPLSIPAIFD
ncbi:hypothetical protein M9Y10_008564 [Tritrichomonas musculus]|uniref:Uncharacterized protein n=1 Tax=Tritrichomonas musculus TaxID=1915356 RepID=A0ABR2IZ81_9EUKA